MTLIDFYVSWNESCQSSCNELHAAHEPCNEDQGHKCINNIRTVHAILMFILKLHMFMLRFLVHEQN